MNSIKSIFVAGLFVLMAVGFVGCNEDVATVPVASIRVDNLTADPTTGFNPNTGAPIGTTGKFTFFSFKTGQVVPDSASTSWDLGFRATTIIVNSPTSGPGTTQAQIVSGIFDEILEAPLDGYKSDNKNAVIKNAIPTGAGNGWYTAEGGGPSSPTIIRPIAGKVIIVKTTEGRYAKLEILSYYKDAPANLTGTEPSRYYTFRYVFQPGDTRSFNQ